MPDNLNVKKRGDENGSIKHLRRDFVGYSDFRLRSPIRAKSDNNSSIRFQASPESVTTRLVYGYCGRRSLLGVLVFATTTRHFMFPFICKHPRENNKPRVAGPPERKS